MYECFTGLPPFNAESVEQVHRNIIRGSIQWPTHYGEGEDEEEISDEALDLMKRLLEPDPKQRLGSKGIQEIKDHAFFADIDWKTMLKSPVPYKPEIEPVEMENVDA